MGDVIHMKPNVDVPTALRNIADAFERGEFPDNSCTVIIGKRVFHSGHKTDEQAADGTLWDCVWGIHKLMSRVAEDD